MIKKLLGFCLFLLSIASFSYANLSISPLKFEYDLKPGETITDKIKVTNNTGGPVTLYTSKEDFIAGDDTGTPKFIKPQDQTNKSISLSEWININAENITLENKESREITFQLKVPQVGEPGGHYGAIFFSSGIPNSGQVAVVQRMGVLLLVNVEGEITVSGNLNSWNIGKLNGNNIEEKKSIDEFPISFGINFENLGNVHIKPKGQILIFNEKGERIEKIGVKDILSPNGVKTGEEIVDYLPINDENGNVLPNSTRKFIVNWNGYAEKIYEKINFLSLQDKVSLEKEELTKDIKPWETIKEVNVTKKYKAQINLSYVGKDGKQNEFNGEKEFNVTYKQVKKVISIYVIIGGIILLAFIAYYITIGKKKTEERIKKKLLEEMKNAK
ncbi:MAG: DUF916 domain-containing protein [Candidatus Absconditabacteria bacterium]